MISFAKRLVNALLVFLMLVTGLSLLAQKTPQKTLQISVKQVETRSRKLLFEVQLHNKSDQPIALQLGTMGYNGRLVMLEAIKLLLEDGAGKQLVLGPKDGGISPGRVDPWVMLLPPGSTMVLPLDLLTYVSPKANIWELKLAPGRYALRAEFSGMAVSESTTLDISAMSSMPFWSGTEKTTAVRFTVFNRARRRKKHL